MKRIIINADDFGLSKGINKGIIKAYREGIVTSASLMVNMPAFEDAVGLIKDNPGLDVGLHINFLRGRPVFPFDKNNTLTDKNGFFLGSVFRIAGRIYQRRINLVELELECDAQIRKALDRDINITHIDSEKHLHLISHVYKIIIKLAKKYGINKIRNINEFPYIVRFIFNKKNIFDFSLYKAALLYFLPLSKKRINSSNFVKTVDYSFGLFDGRGMISDRYEKIFNYLKDGTTEIFCHPGYIDEEWRQSPLNSEKYFINTNREKELEALLSSRLKEIIYKLDIELINYRKL